MGARGAGWEPPRGEQGTPKPAPRLQHPLAKDHCCQSWWFSAIWGCSDVDELPPPTSGAAGRGLPPGGAATSLGFPSFCLRLGAAFSSYLRRAERAPSSPPRSLSRAGPDPVLIRTRCLQRRRAARGSSGEMFPFKNTVSKNKHLAFRHKGLGLQCDPSTRFYPVLLFQMNSHQSR